MPSNHKFTFYGEGDKEPGKEAGDIIVQLKEKEGGHELYQRHGNDLSTKMDIDIQEALCGINRTLK